MGSSSRDEDRAIELAGGADMARRRLDAYTAAEEELESAQVELRVQHPGEWVATHHGDVISHDPFLHGLPAECEDIEYDPDSTAIKYMDMEDRVNVL